MEQTVIANDSFIHNRDGYRVRVLDLQDIGVEMKDPNDARWQPAVAYQVEEDGPIKVRPEADFLAKFTKDEEQSG